MQSGQFLEPEHWPKRSELRQEDDLIGVGVFIGEFGSEYIIHVVENETRYLFFFPSCHWFNPKSHFQKSNTTETSKGILGMSLSFLT